MFAGINGEFKIGVKNFAVISQTEDGNIFKVKVTMNPPAAPEVSTAPQEAEDVENKES